MKSTYFSDKSVKKQKDSWQKNPSGKRDELIKKVSVEYFKWKSGEQDYSEYERRIHNIIKKSS